MSGFSEFRDELRDVFNAQGVELFLGSEIEFERFLDERGLVIGFGSVRLVVRDLERLAFLDVSAGFERGDVLQLYLAGSRTTGNLGTRSNHFHKFHSGYSFIKKPRPVKAEARLISR